LKEARVQSTLVSRAGENRMWFVVLDGGEEAKQALLELTAREGIAAASFLALGAFEKATLAYFDWDGRQYRSIPVDGQVEVITLAGDIVPDEKGKPSLHAHAVLGLPDGHTRGGHLLEGIVRPTLEITVTETPGHLVRRRRPEMNLSLVEASGRNE
jgi:predicted DNA-binding protein with PD1-like motif